MLNRCYIGDCLDGLREFAAAGIRVQTCVTSPPYWNLRDYGVDGQIGLEPTLEQWVDRLVDVFRTVREILSDDGTLWLNLGDGYASAGGPGWQGKNGQRSDRRFTLTRDSVAMRENARRPPLGYKPKDLLGQPWRVGFALQDDGWYLRQDIIWHKPNPMPESTRDRCTKAHEYLFLLSKQPRYYYDAAAIAEPRAGTGDRGVSGWASGDTPHDAVAHNRQKGDARNAETTTSNRRSVWTIATEPCSEAHFATFPTKLVEPCILAGSRPGDIVLDPFLGSGTTAQVAERLGRQWIGCEINPEYVALQRNRLRQTAMIL